MNIMQQGDTYNEEGSQDQRTDAEKLVNSETADDGDEEEAFGDESDDEEDDSPQIETIFGIPKKFVIIGGAVLFLLIAIGIVTSVSGKKSSTATEASATEAATDWMASTSEETTEDATESATEDATETPEELAAKVLDSDENAETLSSYGYTASEIELAEEYGLDVNTLVDNAEARRNQVAVDAIKRMSDTGSKEYQKLLNETYLGQADNDAPVDQTTVDTPYIQKSTITVNSDYVKCPLKGAQLQLKCKVYDNVYVWYTVEPARWCTLPDSGNIVLNVDIARYGNSTYITGVREKDSDLQTVEGNTDD